MVDYPMLHRNMARDACPEFRGDAPEFIGGVRRPDHHATGLLLCSTR